MSSPFQRAKEFFGFDGARLPDDDFGDPEAWDQPGTEVVESYSEVTPFPTPTAVPDGDAQRIVTIRPQSYSKGGPLIGKTYRDRTPVIIDLSRMTEAEARHLIDFCSGLAYGLNGHIERITARVYLLSHHRGESREEGATPGASSSSALPSFLS